MNGFKLVEDVGAVTNNQAEYMALLKALNLALAEKVNTVKVYSDSELLVRQLAGEYRVKDPQLRKLHKEVSRLVKRFEKFSVQWVPREKNEAGKLLA
jgi:ribonuclease HI